MKVYFVREYDEEYFLKIDDGSMVIIGHSLGTKIDLSKELDMESRVLDSLAKYSKRKNLVILIGIEANIYTRKYLSVAVIDSGKIMGISDMTHSIENIDNYRLGTSYRLYDTHLGNVGVVVGNDRLVPEVIRAISRRESEYIVELSGGILLDRDKIVQKSLSYLNGMMIFSMADNVSLITSREGEIIYESDLPFDRVSTLISSDNRLRNSLRFSIYDNVYQE